MLSGTRSRPRTTGSTTITTGATNNIIEQPLKHNTNFQTPKAKLNYKHLFIYRSRWWVCFPFMAILYLALAFSRTDLLSSAPATTIVRRTGYEMDRSEFILAPPPHPSDATYGRACDPASMVNPNVTSAWEQIDQYLKAQYANERVSGGIFLYPRQAALLSTLVREISSRLAYRRRVRSSRQSSQAVEGPSVRLCETGFGAGHSLALFATAASTNGSKSSRNRNSLVIPMEILSFDKFDRPYQLPIWQRLNETHGEHLRMRYVAGDSCRTVPQALSSTSCDILHGSSLCGTDNWDLVAQAPCGALLTSTAMGSLEDRAVYFGPKAQWRRLRDHGCITDPVCFREDVLEIKERDFVFAKQGSKHTSKFCIAMTTGKCSKPNSHRTAIRRPHQRDDEEETCSTRSDLYEVVSQLGLDRFCPQYQIAAPL